MFFDQILDSDGNVVYTKQIEMVRVKSRLSVLASIGGVNIPSQISDFDIFDLTIGSEPFTGVQTPVFDETKVVVMPQGGFLGALWTALVNLGTAISEAFGPVILGFWNAFVGFMDTIFTWAGWPNGFSQLTGWISQFFTWMVSSVTYAVSLLTSTFTLLITWLPLAVTNFVSITAGLVNIFSYLQWIYVTASYGGANLSEILTPFLPLIPLAYFLWLLTSRDMEHIFRKIKLSWDFVQSATLFFVRIADFVIDLVHKIIEAVPIAE